MGTYTPNLNLFNTNMLTDGEDLFDFKRDLNDNNDKIDTAVGKLANLTTTDKSNIVNAINEVKASSGAEYVAADEQIILANGSISPTPPTPTGNDKNYVHIQATASNVWEVTHNLNKYPAVSVVDSANNEIICGVEYLSLNACKLTFSGSFTGQAYFN